MNKTTPSVEIDEGEARGVFLDFLESVSRINAIIDSPEVKGPVEEGIGEELEVMTEIAEEVYGTIVDEPVSVPETPFDVEEAVEWKHEKYGLPKDQIRGTFSEKYGERESISVRRAWFETMRELDRECQINEIREGTTSVSDWQ